MTRAGIVIVGGGVAGQAVVEAVRRHDEAVSLTLVCAEPRPPYDRARLSELLAGAHPGELSLRPHGWYAEHGVRLVLGMRAASLQPAPRRLRLDDGETLAYTRAVLCTGSETPPLAGAYAFRDPEDCAAIRAAAAEARRAVVIGGGRRGLAAACGIAARGCAVTVVEPATRAVRLSRDDDGADGVVLAGGERLDAQLVVCVATRPQTALARSAGLTVDHAVVVDERMRTSAAGVLAVGACARHEAELCEQARLAAAELLGLVPARPALPAVPPAAAVALA